MPLSPSTCPVSVCMDKRLSKEASPMSLLQGQQSSSSSKRTSYWEEPSAVASGPQWALMQGPRGLALVLTLGQLPGLIPAPALPVGSAEAAAATILTATHFLPSVLPFFFYKFISWEPASISLLHAVLCLWVLAGEFTLRLQLIVIFSFPLRNQGSG